MEIISLYEGADLDASFRGVAFTMIDHRDEPGRRIIRFLFPGIDTAVFQDLGQDDGAIRISGIYVGDDYMQQGALLSNAFQTQGPATLVHPWLGTFQAVLAERPQIRYADQELRVLRFTATFWRVIPRTPPALDTQGALFDQLDDLRGYADDLLGQVLGPVATVLAVPGYLVGQVLGATAQVLSVVGYVQGFADTVEGYWSTLVANATGIGSELLAPIAQVAIDALSTINQVELGVDYAEGVAALLAGPSAALLGAAQPVVLAAVGPGGSTTPPQAADPAMVANLLFSAATMIAARAADPAPGPAVSLATQALVVADAVQAASDIQFTSQQDASTWQATQMGALDALASAAQLLGLAYPSTAGRLWQATINTKAAVAADMTAIIGRLPAVITFTPPQRVPVWLLAQYLAGDTPSVVFATYNDLVTRNNVANPAIGPAGPIETLQQ